MKRLIYLEDAIDALEREKTYSAVYKYGYTQTDYFKQYNMGLTDGIKALNKLPSAQPEHTETHSCDCERTETHDLISRQAAIDAVNGMPDCPNGFSGTYDKAAIIGILEDVPSVQPQLSEEDATIWLNGFISGAYIRGME